MTGGRHPVAEGRRLHVAAPLGAGRAASEPPVLVATKLCPPRVRAAWVERPALHQRLDAGADRGLTLVAAPAGYGKTTLLASWYAYAAEHRPLAWLTLDAGDNDPVVLWTYLVEALGRVCSRIGPSLTASAGAGRVVSQSHLTRLVNALEDQPGLALVLDDVHLLSAGPARDTLTWFVEHAPATFQLVVASRRDPELPLARLRAHGDLVELRVDDLRFTREEAAALLNGHEDLDLSVADVDLLVDRTDGWPAGLTLAALSLRRLGDRHGFVDRFGASHRHVLDFLETEALHAHDPADQELMIRCSVLEELSGPLCDAVLGTTGSDERLRRLAHVNLFLQPHDDEGGTYRFHPLFAQLLRMHLHRRGPEVARALHRRAYAWHRTHGPTRCAVDHAIDAGLFPEAAALVLGCWAEQANIGRCATVLGWLSRFPRDLLAADVRLLLVQAWALSLAGRRQEADAVLREVEALGTQDPGPLPDGFGSVAASLHTLRAVFPWGDVAEMDAHARQAVALEEPDSPWRAMACWARGTALYLRGAPEEADPWLADAVDRGEAAGQWLALAGALGCRSLVAGLTGRHQDQVELAARATDVAHAHGLEPVAAAALLASGVALADEARPQEALAVLERAVVVARFWAQPLPLASALLHEGAVLRALGRTAQAGQVLAEADGVLADCPDPGFLAGTRRARALWSTSAVARSQRGRAAPAVPPLTPSELRVLAHLDGRLTEADIARELYVTHATVHSHTKAIYRKLGVTTRAQALARASGLGLLP
ncbi:helix-turn-helix transcriptional regulator [Cellulomonas soli]|uniref:helix-turn-helix transcriptional regulator n=1 Tax=Cellulomonas soli TaxID=931535 RepID=UPI0015CAF35F|nr:LuxR family transcriptional regulator [Cellulomonas soli]NYI60528.1 LuxR family maltose regulon positive regulatory protein [Cellulomonas soli]